MTRLKPLALAALVAALALPAFADEPGPGGSKPPKPMPFRVAAASSP